MLRRKIKVAVLMGGPSEEHEVSLNTGRQILENLDPVKYIVEPVVITKKRRWLFSDPILKTPKKIERKIAAASLPQSRALAENSAVEKVAREKKADVVFIALHGKYGEDGTVQGLLEAVGLPYTGSGVLASALGMNKPRSLSVLRDAGLAVPEFRVLGAREVFEKRARFPASKLVHEFSLPLVVKPADHGSSIGVSIVKRARDVVPALHDAFRYCREAMVQRFIDGKELTCGVIEQGKTLRAFTPIEIVPRRGDFYNYASKYEDGGSDHFIPPRGVSKKILGRVRDAAVRTHKALGCRGMSRTDFILARDNTPYVLEINTIPGMTATSLLPQAASHDGVDFSQLLDIIIRRALER